MTDDDWTDHLAGARIAVDQRFEDRVIASEFSNQQWGLIMSAVEFDIEAPADPEAAELVAVTDQVESIVPELGKIERQMAGVPGSGGKPEEQGLAEKVKGWLGMDSRNDGDRLAEARVLVDEYATELQRYLEDEGRWADICELAAADD